MAENLGANFSIDVSALKKGLQTANKLIRESESEFKAAAAGMGDWTKSQEGLEKRIKSLNDIAGVQQKKVDALKAEYNRLIDDGLDPSSEKAISLRTQINNETAALEKSKAEIEKQTKALNELGNESEDAENGLKDVSDGAEKANKSFSLMDGVLANLVASGIKAAISAFTDLAKSAVDTYKEMETGSDNLIKATGATGDAAKDLQKSYKNVSKEIVGDFGDIGSAMGEVNTRFGYTGKELEDTTEQFLKFSEITGTDATQAVQIVSKAIEGAGLESKDYNTLLDQLAVAAQASGVSVDKLADGITKNGSTMRSLGFDTSETIAIISQMEKAGVNTETALAGMKKAAQEWGKAGKDPRKEFEKTIEAIKNAPNETKATELAFEAFGNKAGVEMADAIKTGRFEYEDFLKTIEGSEGTVSKTYDQTQSSADKVKLAMQNLRVSAADLVDKVITKYSPQIEKALNAMKKVVDKVFPAIEKGFNWISKHGDAVAATIAGVATALGAFMLIVKKQAIMTAFTTALNGIKVAFAGLNAVMAANPIGLIVAAIAGLVAAFVVLWNKSETFRNFWIGLWENIKNAVMPVIEGIVQWFEDMWEKMQPIVEMIKEKFTAAVEEVKVMFEAAWAAIQAIWDAVEPYFTALVEGITVAFSFLKDNLGEFFTEAWAKIQEVWDAVEPYFKRIWENIKIIFSAVGKIIGGYFKMAWKNIKVVWDLVVGYFKMVWDNIKLIFSVVEKVFKGDFSGAWEAIKQIWNNVVGYFQKVWDGIKSIFGNVLVFFKTSFSAALDAVKAIWDTVKAYYEGIWTGIKTIFSGVGDWFRERFDDAKTGIEEIWSGVTGFFSSIWTGIKTKFSNVGTWFKDKFKTAWENIKSVFNLETVKNFFGDLWDGIKDKFTNIGTSVGTAVGGAFKTAINWAIDKIEEVLNFLPENVNGALQSITDLTGVSLPLFPTVDLPRLAKGGVVKQATAAIIGEAGKEAVVPLEHNTEWIDMLADKLADKIGGGGVVVNQTNNYSQAHTRYEIYKSQQATAAAVKLALSR